MQTLQQAKKLAQMMVTISDLAGKKVVALLSDMNQPLGNAVGNSLEVEEAINVLEDLKTSFSLKKVAEVKD